jgi:hypothetical protein
MTYDQIVQINRERLERWRRLLNNQHATALILVGIGHDHVSGQVQVIATEDGPYNADLAAFLRLAAHKLDPKGDG